MNKFKRRILALFSLFSFLLNFSSLGFPLIILAQEVPSPTPVPVVKEVQEETQENNDEDETLTTPTPETVLTLQEDNSSTSDDKQDQADSNLVAVPSPDLLSSYEPPPSATILPQEETKEVEKVCLGDEKIKETTNDNWQIDLEKGIVETKEKVKLGFRYVYPQENKVTVTFKCLPKDESFRTPLKIQQIKVSDLKLPEDVKLATDYAYDITTGMEDGTFEYDVTLPKLEGQEADVSYIEKSVEEVKNQSEELKPEDLKAVDENKLSQEGEVVKASRLDNFYIYLVTVTPGELTV